MHMWPSISLNVCVCRIWHLDKVYSWMRLRAAMMSWPKTLHPPGTLSQARPRCALTCCVRSISNNDIGAGDLQPECSHPQKHASWLPFMLCFATSQGAGWKSWGLHTLRQADAADMAMSEKELPVCLSLCRKAIQMSYNVCLQLVLSSQCIQDSS